MDIDGPLRIVHCFRSPIGGIFRHVRDLVCEHSAAGHQIGIVCDSSTGGDFEQKLFDEIAPQLALGVTRFPINRSISPRDFGAFWEGYKKIKSLQPHVLHGHGAKGGAIARVVGSLLRVERYRVARLYSPHGGSLHFNAGFRGRGIFLLERFLERFGDATVFVCRFEQDAYFKKIGKPHNKSRVIYNGVGEDEFRPVQLTADPYEFEYIGMMRDLKGADLFIKAFAEAERIVGEPLSAVMIGDGPDQQKYQTTMIELGLGQRITMMPAMKQRNAFKLAKVIVVPSRAEAMPYIVLETVAAGKPLIATRVGGIPEVLGEDNPALVNPGDWQELGQTMARSIADKSWKTKAKPDMARVHDVFSTATMATEMLSLYRELLEGR